MKELSIEEKAKRYDEAYKVAENIHRFSSDLAEIKRMEQIFPELKESEDEKWIPKEIAKYLKEKGGFRSCWAAWLEKQGYKDEEILVLKDQIESLHAAIRALKEAHKIEFKKQGEQKPAWSEEDEKMRNRAIKLISPDNNHSDYAKYKLQIVEWLKSLKPQNTWKPTEEQIGVLDIATSFLEPYSGHSRCLIELQKQLKAL